MKDRECNIYLNTYKCPMKDCEGCRYRYVEKKPEFEQMLRDERNKTIDEFAEQIKELFKYESAWGKIEYHQRFVIDISKITEIAEQMKGE